MYTCVGVNVCVISQAAILFPDTASRPQQRTGREPPGHRKIRHPGGLLVSRIESKTQMSVSKHKEVLHFFSDTKFTTVHFR